MNDERPIEKLLRRFAKKRRDEAGAPVELHPANRRLLQAEVARQFPKAQRREGWWAGLSLLLNRKVAYAVALVAVVSVTALLIVPASKKERSRSLMALDSKKVAAPESSSAPMPAVMTETVRELKDRETSPAKELAAVTSDSFGGRNEPVAMNEKREFDAGTLSAPAAAPSPVVTLAPAARSSSANLERERATVRRQQVAESVADYKAKYPAETASKNDSQAYLSSKAGAIQPAQPPALAANLDTVQSPAEAEVFSRRYGVATTASAAPATGLAKATALKQEITPTDLGGGKLNEGMNTTQAFSQIATDSYATPGLKQASASPVLMNFVVEQSGQQIRVTDSDGSTYSGLVQLAADEDMSRKDFIARGGGLEKPTGARPAPGINRNSYQPAVAQNGQSSFFRLTGTNRTLKQQVSFVGNFVTLTNQLPGANAQFQYADKAKDAYQQQFVPLLQNSGIKGRLQVGSGREMEFNAVPVKQ